MQKRFESSVTVSGRGDSKAQACADALSGVQRAVTAAGHPVLLRIEPMRVTVVAAEEIRRRERFLFFFLPRDRLSYAVTLEVEVSVTALDIEAVPFVARQV